MVSVRKPVLNAEPHGRTESGNGWPSERAWKGLSDSTDSSNGPLSERHGRHRWSVVHEAGLPFFQPFLNRSPRQNSNDHLDADFVNLAFDNVCRYSLLIVPNCCLFLCVPLAAFPDSRIVALVQAISQQNPATELGRASRRRLRQLSLRLCMSLFFAHNPVLLLILMCAARSCSRCPNCIFLPRKYPFAFVALEATRSDR